jgi:hypothetical protein
MGTLSGGMCQATQMRIARYAPAAALRFFTGFGPLRMAVAFNAFYFCYVACATSAAPLHRGEGGSRPPYNTSSFLVSVKTRPSIFVELLPCGIGFFLGKATAPIRQWPGLVHGWPTLLLSHQLCRLKLKSPYYLSRLSRLRWPPRCSY